jgi:DNA modification methylase
MTQTLHRLITGNAGQMDALDENSVDLVLTSPPYPMIEMWDGVFCAQSPTVKSALEQGQGQLAFEHMHQVLDHVWRESLRVLKPGGIMCINIGDATRSLNGQFALYANHARILNQLLALGFSSLPAILWRKPTNAPTKFMGSGMYPPGAYVTLEHEYILIVRNGAKREFKGETDKRLRRQSAYFWEERNRWFSDIWTDLKGVPQALADKGLRQRSAAFPFELPYRLIAMFSVQDDLVLDPFAGIGTTMLAAMATARNSIGIEIDPNLAAAALKRSNECVPLGNQQLDQRLRDHLEFVKQRTANHGPLKYRNQFYGFAVMTRQEKDLRFMSPAAVSWPQPDCVLVDYHEGLPAGYRNLQMPGDVADPGPPPQSPPGDGPVSTH